MSEAVAGIGFSWSSTSMVGSVINRWCKENTGTITGAALAAVSTSSIGMFFAFVRVPISAIALPLETVILPLYANDLFGEKSYNKVMGIVISANVLGYAVGTPLTNVCYDIFGTYKPILLVMGFIMLFVVITLQFVIKSAHRTRDAVVAKETEEKLLQKI